MKMAEGCCSGASFLFIFGLLVTQRWLGSSVFAIPEKRDDDALRREYPLEEFLWTGSGDGPEHEGEGGGVSWLTTTVFRTTTRLLAPPASASLQLSQPSASCPLPASCSLLTPSPTWPTDESPSSPVFTLEPSERSIVPSMSSRFVAATPSLVTPSVTHTSWPVLPSDRPPDRQGDGAVPEQRFWIVTVVEEEDQRRAPDTSLLAVGLARLYATAFKRQQERHLGIINATNGVRVTKLSEVMSRRRRVATDVEPLTSVHVRVHNVSEGEPRRVQLVYSVHVRGRPVLARAAVHDMRLVSDAEVAHELGGLSIVTKAEPYLKEKEQAAWTPFSTSPWVLAGGAISAVALLALVLILLLLATTRHKRARRIAGREQEARGGTTNASFEPDEPRASSDRGSVSAGSDTKMLPSEEGDWGVDSESLDMPPPSAGQAEAAIAAAVAAARSRSAGVSSPSSYLSMPSVRRFPRGGNIPEPLSQVLGGGDVRGCLSMRNLDLYPDETAFEPRPGVSTPPPPVPRSPWGARHGSLDGEDPGVIGPCVYQMARGAGPARRRFHELLDDAFSLFGGRSDEDRSPTPPPRPPSPRILDSRVHSAAQARVSEPESPPLRPKTSEPRRAGMQQPRRSQAPGPDPPAGRVGSAGPRGAWETPVEGSNVRPLSAGPFHRPRLPEASKPPPYRAPRISTERILCDAELPPTDPAVPLINAIKDELQRLQSCTSCSTTPLPGSCPPSAQSKK